MAVPNTTTFTLQDVVNNMSHAVSDLIACFGDANELYFNPTYSGSKNSLLNFRDYGPHNVPTSLGYGYLYNSYAMIHPNFLTTSWRVPTTSDFSTLNTYISSNGGLLKQVGITHWTSPNTGATNSTGFTALPNGARAPSGLFGNITQISQSWTTTPLGGTSYYHIRLMYDSAIFEYITSGSGLQQGNSVRLIKNTTTLTNGQTSTMTDYDGNVYDTICIGTQEWTVQNWKCTKLNDGTPLTKVTDNTTWAAATTGNYYYCAYNNTESNV